MFSSLSRKRVFVLLTSGSLSLTQSVISLLRSDFDRGEGLAVAPSLYDAARVIGNQIRQVSDLDRALGDDQFDLLVIGGGLGGAQLVVTSGGEAASRLKARSVASVSAAERVSSAPTANVRPSTR